MCINKHLEAYLIGLHIIGDSDESRNAIIVLFRHSLGNYRYYIYVFTL